LVLHNFIIVKKTFVHFFRENFPLNALHGYANRIAGRFKLNDRQYVADGQTDSVYFFSVLVLYGDAEIARPDNAAPD